MSVLTPQEERIAEGLPLDLKGADKRARVSRMLAGFRNKPPRVAIERARLMTESFRQTEQLPLVLRWAKALQNIMTKIPVYIGPDDLIVGRCGPPGRYGLIYPELRAGWLARSLRSIDTQKQQTFVIADDDLRTVQEEVLPYWEGKTYHEAYISMLPEDTRRIIWEKDDIYTHRGIVGCFTTMHSTLNWAPDYAKVLKRGFNGIKKEAEERLANLSPYNRENGYDKLAFLQAVIIVCDAMIAFAKRYSDLARQMADRETNKQRKAELLEIAETCAWVPGNPARSFREAIQSQWFVGCGYRFEQLAGGVIGNGRIDQYLYPYYKADIENGRITDDEVLELLECLWLNMAQCVRLLQTGTIDYHEGYPHFEQTVIGGQTDTGKDASNQLSYLVLRSKKEFPLDYPDLSVRIHSRTPDAFLIKVCELIKEGTGYPKLLNDEEIIPLLLAKGATLEEARDYTGSGCTEVRMPNRDTYMTQGAQINLAALLEMALNDGRMRRNSGEQLGLRTGDAREFRTYEEVVDAFKAQTEFFLRHFHIKQDVLDSIRAQNLAAPLQSCLHDLCMKQCVDMNYGFIEGAVKDGNCFAVGFGTVVDSLAAIKKLVYDDRKVTMSDLLQALETNFQHNEILRQMCLNAPKYGNNDPYVDSIGYKVENILVSVAHRYTNYFGGKNDIAYVPVTAHVGAGAIVGATPNGRKAGEPLSEGISPTQGCDIAGPTATLLSVDATKNAGYTERAARLLNLKISPQAVAGEKGTRDLASMIRTWCDMKFWHIQFNIINRQTLVEAQKNPENYRNLLVRVAGYSAYFVDLSPKLQNEIIARTEHAFL